jgi:hypothetical protein
MDSSRGFGSNRCYSLHALFRLGFPLAPPLYRSLTRNNDSLAGSFYKRHAISPCWLLPQWPLTACKYEVSGSLSSPSRGAFHLSLTVLVHYRSLKVCSLGGWSPQLPTRFHVPRGTQDPSHSYLLSPTGLSPSTVVRSSTFGFRHTRFCWSYNPALPSREEKEQRFGLLPVRSPLLRESHLISSRRATEMFQFTRFPPSLPIYSAGGLQTSLWRGCPIRILRAHRSHAAPPERFAGLRVLLRPSAPRHPPRTLASLFSVFSSLLLLRPSVPVAGGVRTPSSHLTHARALLVCACLMIVFGVRSFVRSLALSG